MKKYTIPAVLHLNCEVYNLYESHDCEVSVDVKLSGFDIYMLSDLVARHGGDREAARKGLEQALPGVYKKLDDAVNAAAKKFARANAIINIYWDQQLFYDDEPKMMEVFAKEGLWDPEENYGGDDRRANFSIWLEEYVGDLEWDKQAEFIEKYYGYVLDRLTPDMLEYTYSFSIPILTRI